MIARDDSAAAQSVYILSEEEDDARIPRRRNRVFKALNPLVAAQIKVKFFECLIRHDGAISSLIMAIEDELRFYDDRNGCN
mgnify:CR=1 FL=1